MTPREKMLRLVDYRQRVCRAPYVRLPANPHSESLWRDGLIERALPGRCFAFTLTPAGRREIRS